MVSIRYYVTILSLLVMAAVPASAQYQKHYVRYITGLDSEVRLPAQFQFVSTNWGGPDYNNEIDMAVHPMLVYSPEKDRLMMMSVHGNPSAPAFTFSDDRGNTWSAPEIPNTQPHFERITHDASHSLSDLGNGRAMFESVVTITLDSTYTLWYTDDFGQTWKDPTPCRRMSNGHNWANWDPIFREIDPKTGEIVKLMQTGYDVSGIEKGKSGTFIRFSKDLGKTWYDEIQVPQWKGISEINLQWAKNGNLVAGCRTDNPIRFDKWGSSDHRGGMAVCVSKDKGLTWSEPNRLFDWGRHHASVLTMPDGTIVLTYVVRRGYCNTNDGVTQYGVEAIISRDNGETWDLDHKYILESWVGLYGDPTPQSTSSLMLPDGSILTAFGTGHASTAKQGRRDAGLVRWRLVDKPAEFGGPITEAYYTTKLRNEYDPAPKKNIIVADESK